MATPVKDRREKVIESTTFNGIDFIEVATSDQMTLLVHFLNSVDLKGTVTSPIINGGETIPTVAVLPINDATDWSTDAAGNRVLRLQTRSAGDFSIYTLSLTSNLLDAFFADSRFSFKARCPSTLDCNPIEEPCPPESGDAPPVDYLAKDFLSFRKALLDFSALRYPEWQERSEADFGMMFLESLASAADDLSYFQDRVAQESALDTAVQRRSVVRHARLVDYEPRPATCARTLLQFDVTAGPILPGVLVSALGPDGVSIEFETGTGLNDQGVYTVSRRWNRMNGSVPNILPYYWDDSQRCLENGATEMWVLGQGYNFSAGQLLLIETTALVPADPPVRELITVASADEQSDPLFPGPPNPATLLTHIVFSTPLASDHDLSYADDLGRPRTLLAGNLVPATQARRFRETFAIDTPPASAFQTPLALVRDGANQATTPDVVEYLYPLSNAPLAWLGDAADAKADPLPEMILTEQPGSTNPILWTWEQKLLDAEKFENAFTVEPARYVEVNRNSDGTRFFDYAGEDGDTIRFGDGVFGSMPQSGSVFEVQYRVGGGTAGNVAADAITRFDPTASSLILSVTNPFPASGGADAEPIETVRRLAPQAFRAVQFRAVRPEDYENAAETLPWVERAGTVFRWTGSWLTVFTTADPKGGEDIPVPLRTQLIDLLNRYRLAGYESYAPAPQYGALDLSIEVCARSDAFQADVETAVLAALSATKPSGLFYPDNFTFGTPLERSALEAAIQNAYGVGGVYSIQYVRRGVTLQPVEMPDTISISNDEILRVDNDPSRPERGSLNIQVKGGK